jgi:transposase InsO family protein
MLIYTDLSKTSGNYKKYILVITDAFTKYVELVAIDNKEAVTVTEAIFRRWICRYGVPLEIITDQGKEFCNKLSDELYKLLQTKHLTTSSRHPACNAQAEVANKTICQVPQ